MTARPAWNRASAVLALALPLLFLHVDLQPKAVAPIGEGVQIVPSDLALVAVLVAAFVAGRRHGWEPLRTGRGVFVAAGVLLALIAVGTVLPIALGREYAAVDHAVTALKFVEYATLALAVPLLVRTRADLRLVLLVLVAWTALAAAVAVLQFIGALPEFRGYRPGGREPSFLGYHDLAALAGATLAVGLARIALGPLAGLGPVAVGVAIASGMIGVVLSGALAGFLGVLAAAGGAALLAAGRGELTLQRATALLAISATVGAGVFALRAPNIESFLRFVGIQRSSEPETFGGESYVQRLALGYIGVRTFADHPVLGVGWQASSEEWTYRPYLEDARERYPRLPESSLPSPARPWGIQNAYIQAAAELGVAGALAFFAALLVPIRHAWRSARRALEPASAALPMLCLLVTMGVWLGLGIVAGIPLVALMWLAIGLAAAPPVEPRAG